MLEYYQIHDLQEIANKLLIDDKPEYIPDKELEYELSWNFSLFISKILINSKQKLSLTKISFTTELNNYNKLFNTNIVLEKLEKKFWIINIFDEIKIPHTVFSFCRELYNDTEKQNKYIDNPDYEDLLFLGYMADKYGYEDSRPFIIEKVFFNNLYDTFKHLYPQIISQSEIIELLELNETDDKLYYTYIPFHVRQTVLNDKVSYYVWKTFSSTYNDLEDAIKKWSVLLEQFWTSDFIKFLSDTQKETFVENAIRILKNEKYLIFDKNTEYNKLICDLNPLNNFDDSIFLQKDEKKFEINYADYFLLYMTRNSHFDLHAILINQESKDLYLNLLSPILKTNNPLYIGEILSDKENKYPYLFSDILSFLRNAKPGTLLNFINEEDYGLVFYISFIELCFEKINLPKSEIIKESIISMMKKVINLFVKENFNQYPFKYKQFARILMWLEKFYSQIDQRTKIYNIKKDIYNYHKNLLKKSFSQQRHITDFNKLLDSFREEKDFILTSSNDFQLSQIAFLFSILDIANEQHNDEAVNTIVDKIYSIYLKNITSKEKLYMSYEFPLIENFDWGLFYNVLYLTDRSKNFITQTVETFVTPVDTDTSNFDATQANVYKYKLLLKILCLTYNSCPEENKEYFEKLILDFLPYCFKDDYAKHCINIFSSTYESSFDKNINTAIFPLLVKTANIFSQDGKSKFIKTILENGNFRLLFKAYNLITFNDGQKQIEDFVKDSDFSSKINEIYTIPDFIEIVTNVANSRIDEDFENLLFDELNNIIISKAKEGYVSEYTYQAELLKLFHLYKLKKTTELEAYNFPFNESSQKYIEYKQLLNSNKLFYKALLDLDKEKYREALNTIELICKKYPDNNQYQIYKVYIKSLILEEKDNSQNRKLLLEEIESLEKKDIQNIELLLFTKLRIYILSKDYDLALYFYQSLDDDLKSDIDFSYIIIKALINNNRNDIAINIFNRIDQRFYNTHEYNELKTLIPVEQILPQLQSSYSSILTFNPEKRFMVLPSSINNHNNDIGEYLLNEIKLALHKILKKIDLVQKISSSNLPEDNISDLLELEINSRLSMLDYTLENQDRSGKSVKGSNAGEIDLELNINDFSIVIEAVKYSSGSSERKKHIEKTFKYDPSRKYIFNLVYFDTNTKTFNEAWDNLKNDIEEAAYPSGFEKENTTVLPSNNAGIKIAKSNHKNGLIYYHIMVNFTYAQN